ncbi:MAG: adenylate/guanylate cyclase domain-containing protein [Kiloniellaceae bacterium]
MADWLMAQALGEAGFEDLLEGCCERLLGAGIPLWRGHVTFRVLHPLYSGMGLTWLRGRGVQTDSYAHPVEGEFPERFKVSPLYHMIRTQVPFLRRHLLGEEAVLDFPVLSEFRDAGATDYLGFLVKFGGGRPDGIAGSWITDRPSGFADQDIRSLLRIQQRLGVACKIRIKDQIARNVVTTYLGPDAGLRVLDGQIRRGDGETIHAVIWYSDLRGSTRMADTLPPEGYIEALNDYFGSAGGAVMAHGGEILAFIGDAVLAIFPIPARGANVDEACGRALAASRDARERLAAVNRTRQEAGANPLSFGLALHVGDVLFGNIGLPERVSFSVIGSTVNEVARLEALTKELDRPVLASEAFARHTSIAWERFGKHRLRGVGKPFEILAPAAE